MPRAPGPARLPLLQSESAAGLPRPPCMTRPPEILTSPLCSGLPFARRHQPDSVPDRRRGPRGTACSASLEHRHALPASPTGQELYSRGWSSRRLHHSGTSWPAAPRPPAQPRLTSPAQPTPPIRPSPPPARIEAPPTAAPRSGRPAAIAAHSAAAIAPIPPQPTPPPPPPPLLLLPLPPPPPPPQCAQNRKVHNIWRPFRGAIVAHRPQSGRRAAVPAQSAASCAVPS